MTEIDVQETTDEVKAQSIAWDDSRMQSTYANVANAASTREEVFLLFGTHQSWRSDQSELTVQLTDRIVMNPYAAKRLSRLLNSLISEYERKYGTLDVSADRR